MSPRAAWTIAVPYLAFLLLPFAWLVLGSLWPDAELARPLPSHLTLENYAAALSGGGLARAARVDGASGWRVFRSITLPLLRPALLLALLFRSLDAFRVFDVVFVLTGGGPGNSTESLSLYAYKTLLRAGSFGLGSAISLVTFLCVVGLGLGWLRALGERRREAAA